MNCTRVEEARKYLAEFDRILSDMENKMLSVKITNSITINFIDCMIPHHQAAIYMCENLLKYTNYEPLKNIADNIIKTQTNGIEQMKRIRMTTWGYINSKEDVKKYMNEYFDITKKMVYRMRNSLRTVNINLNFVSEMIPHHEGAISMCNNLLKYPIDPRLKKVAEAIIEEQSRGVKQLKEIEQNLYRR